jgi:hypothetical protein
MQNGGSSGTVIWRSDINEADENYAYIVFPEPIYVATDCYVDVSNCVASVLYRQIS